VENGDILKTSATIIAKRRETYGDPRDCFDRAAAIASATLNRPVSPYEVVTIIHAVKLARIAQSPKNLDHYVDGVSYLAFAGQFIGAEKEDARRDTKAFVPLPVPDISRGVINTVAPDTGFPASGPITPAVNRGIGGRPVVPLRDDPKPNGA
jgi:hypothetical protein